jgi:flagellar hook assembly protein FlgD
VVPGNASPVIDGAPVFGSVEDAVAGAAPVATLPIAARVRIDWREEAVAADGSNVFRVHADNEIEGWMTGASLIPRDTAAPQVWDADDGSGSFSPNGDGVHDRLAISWDLSEVAAWTVGIADGDGRPLATATGEGQVASMLWAPDAGTVADGEYTWTIEATDAWGNGPLRRSGTVQADTQPPVLSLAPAAGEPTATQPVLTPNGDGALDTIAFAVEASEPGRVVGTIRNAAGDTVDTMAVTVDSAAARLTWDGRTAAGSVVPDGLYAITFMAQDGAGNMSEPQGRTVGVYTSLARMRTSAPIFFPQDGDGLAARVVVAFDLARPAAVTWTIVNAAGATVRTVMTDRALGAGARSWAWDGRNDDGAFVPRGQYTAVVRAVDGELSATMRASVRADAFRVVPSDTTPYRGQLITVTVTTAENLSSAPRVAVSQPGVRGWNIGTVRVATGVYRATIRLKPGATGTLRLRAYGRDSGGRLQDSVISVPLH